MASGLFPHPQVTSTSFLVCYCIWSFTVSLKNLKIQLPNPAGAELVFLTTAQSPWGFCLGQCCLQLSTPFTGRGDKYPALNALRWLVERFQPRRWCLFLKCSEPWEPSLKWRDNKVISMKPALYLRALYVLNHSIFSACKGGLLLPLSPVMLGLRLVHFPTQEVSLFF